MELIEQGTDEFFNTKNMMSMCKEFVKNEFSNQFESNVVQRAAIIFTRSSEFHLLFSTFNFPF